MKNLFPAITLILLPFVLIAQKEITVEDFTTKRTFAQRSVSGINWMNDGKYYTAIDDNKILKYDITTGQVVETILDGNALTPKLAIGSYAFSADENKIMLLTSKESLYRRSYTAEYFVYDRTEAAVEPLSSNGKQSYATFSPDGRKVAFVRSNNLFVVDLASGSEMQMTNDGSFNSIINGTTDWVYEEEFGFVVGFYWSPDSRKLAYYRFDESKVKEYTMQKWNSGALYPENYTFTYPQAGEANSAVEIWIQDIQSGSKVKADLGQEQDIYLPRVQWTSDPNLLSVRKLNRLQNNLSIIHVDASNGTATRVLEEKSSSYIDVETEGLVYLAGNKHFIYASESSGYRHLYLYTMNGKLVRQITSGNFEVLAFIGADEKNKVVYYTSTEKSPLERHFYSIALDGKKKVRLTQEDGAHSINMSDDFQFYIDTYSSANKPITVSLYRTKGNNMIKVLEKNESLMAKLDEHGIVNKEFFTFPGADGTQLTGVMMKPNDFDSTKVYPILIYQYSGPGSQNAINSFGGGHFYFHQYIVQQGYLVAIIDTRGTGGRGAAFRTQTYKQLGKLELEDILSAGKFLGSKNYIDEARIGVWGWSYGGYMSSLAMTKGKGLFKAGIAVAPVTNWRFYDTIYTERFLQTPQLNASGYDDNSPLTFASDLQGNFLLIHGTGDDNVHFQNSVAFQEALINSGKQFQSFYYPDKHHGLPGTHLHLYSMMADFIMKNL